MVEYEENPHLLYVCLETIVLSASIPVAQSPPHKLTNHQPTLIQLPTHKQFTSFLRQLHLKALDLAGRDEV